MKSTNIPEVKLGIIAVSRDCFPIQLSQKRRSAIKAACDAKNLNVYECQTAVENEADMLNCSYNLGMRHLKDYIPECPVGTAAEIADKMAEFIPIARAILGIKDLKIITFGPRPQDFFACNAPIKGLYELGVDVEENSELDLLVSYKEHEGAPASPPSAPTWLPRWARAITTPPI